MASIKFICFALLALVTSNNGLAQTEMDCLVLRENTENEFGYLSAKGDTIIPFGKYEFCFTTRFCSFAIVSKKNKGLIGINRKEEILFNVFLFDNGPDPLSDGVFRIVKNGKIGYADSKGKTIIKPEYDCAEPFIKGKARVGKGCIPVTEGEHTGWTGGKWFFINKHGKTISK
jgi:hypothetical protein